MASKSNGHAIAKPNGKTANGQNTRVIIVRPSNMRARYDAAQTNDDNARHWANADSFGPNAALVPQVRRTLRGRCRYEVANNSYAKGIGLTIANDTVNIGPALQVLSADKPANKRFEMAIWRWMQAINLPEKLRQMRMARYDSGESFAIFENNPGLPGEVKLDMRVYEAEQISDTYFIPIDPVRQREDGIQYDTYGNPTFYRKLRAHPGEFNFFVLPTEYDDIPAKYVFHYFRPDRPGQRRGIPDITPAISDFADLRRFTAATIAAAETAAEHAAVINTDSSADADGAADQTTTTNSPGSYTPPNWDMVPLEKRGALVMPENWKISQLKAEHPINTYKEFVNAKLNEIARCLCVPFHIAAMDPSIANMSSSYVVGQMYTQERLIDRADLERLLEMALAFFVDEAAKIPGYLPELPDNWTHQWFWPSLGHHADPAKVANAATMRMAAGIGSRAHEYALLGLDIEEQDASAAESFGMTVEEYRKRVADKIFGPDPAEAAANSAQNDTNPPNGDPNEEKN